MAYTYHTPDDEREMLAAIGAASTEELFASVPSEIRLQRAARSASRDERTGIDPAPRRSGRQEHPRRSEGLFPGRGKLRPFRPGCCGRLGLPRGVLHLLHAVPAGGESGQPAGDVRVPDADLPAHGHGRFECQSVRRRERRGRGGAVVHEHDPASEESRDGGQRAPGVPADRGDVFRQPRRGIGHAGDTERRRGS